MPYLKDLKLEISEYERNFRHPNMEPYGQGSVYDLFPDEHPTSQEYFKWPDKWPYLYEAGIYAFLSKNLEILYIGKASNNNGLGYRLQSYCYYGNNRECILSGEWNGNPKFIFIFPVPADTRFEAPALKEYLINKLSTLNNKIGT